MFNKRCRWVVSTRSRHGVNVFSSVIKSKFLTHVELRFYETFERFGLDFISAWGWDKLGVADIVCCSTLRGTNLEFRSL